MNVEVKCWMKLRKERQLELKLKRNAANTLFLFNLYSGLPRSLTILEGLGIVEKILGPGKYLKLCRGFRKYWKVLEFEAKNSRPWKVLEFGSRSLKIMEWAKNVFHFFQK